MYWRNILQGGLWLRWVALAIFIAAGVTDILDGYFARIWGQQSALGRMLDPIADKLLVASCLLMLAADDTIRGWSLFAAIVILCREILVSGLREYPGRAARQRAGDAARQMEDDRAARRRRLPDRGRGRRRRSCRSSTQIGMTLLWLSALLTLYTGWDYLRAGVHHVDRTRSVKVLYFAWVRERVGKPEEEIELPAGVAPSAS